MPQKKKKGKERLDKFYHLAKEQNLRARSAFKLIQLDKKYSFLPSARGVLDLCAAPGGWMQVAKRHCPRDTFVCGVDLVPIRTVPGCIGLVGDIHSGETRAALRREIRRAGNAKIDVVLHDGAPNVGSNWHMDAYNQSELVLGALSLAVEFLEPGGVFATKVFRSQDYNNLMWVFKQLFETAQATKPTASRNVSAEIFVVCQGFKAPKRIDPRFLDPKHVFKEASKAAANGKAAGEVGPSNLIPASEGGTSEAAGTAAATTLAARGSVEIFRDPSKKRRKAEGYEEGATLLRRVCPVSRFVASEDPVLCLTAHSEFTWGDDDASKAYAARAATDGEVRALVEDLQVLNKKDFKYLLKWRLKMVEADEAERRAARASSASGSSSLSDGSGGEDSLASTASEGELLDRALDAARSEKEKAEKRKRRALRKKRAKIQRKIDLKMILPGDVIDAPEEDGAFRLATIRDGSRLEKVLTAGPETYDNMADQLEKEATEQVSRGEVYDPRADSSDDEDARIARASAEAALARAQADLAAGKGSEAAAKAAASTLRRLEHEEEAARLRRLDREADFAYELHNGKEVKKKSRLSSKRERVNEELQDFAVHIPRKQHDYVPDVQSAFDLSDGRRAARKASPTPRTRSYVTGAVPQGSDSEDTGASGDRSSSSSDEDAYDRMRALARKKLGTVAEGDRANPLIADASKLLASESAATKAKVWYSNPLFAGIGEDDEDEDEDEDEAEDEDEDENDDHEGEDGGNGEDEGEGDDDDDESDGDNAASAAQGKNKRKRSAAADGAAAESDGSDAAGVDSDAESDFEVAPVEHGSSSEESFDDVADAEILAMGQAMATDKKVKSDLIDDSYNRYTFNDSALPRWFIDDEGKHNRPELPVTREMVDKMKERFRLINSRPIKKIAEARARKKHRAAKTVEKIKSQVSAVVESSEMSEKEKARAVEKLYKGMAHKHKPGKTQIVVNRGNGQQSNSRKGGVAKKAGKVKVVDKRLKADLRGQKAAEKRKGKKRRR